MLGSALRFAELSPATVQTQTESCEFELAKELEVFGGTFEN